ncbi:MAG: hypothetical protein KAI26_08275, partial [Nanoarchaeota archaeon]|nr:hypothetical protein [Nanoarchaeota archaeon]
MYNNFDFEIYCLFNKTLLLIVIFLSLWVGSLVYFSNPSKKQNKLFFLMSILIILWPTFGYLAYFSTDLINAIFWTKLAYASVSLFVIICYFFFVYFLKEEKKFRVFNVFVLLAGVIFILLSVFSDFIIRGVVMQNVGISPIFSLGAYFFYFFVLVVFSFLIYRLNVNYHIFPKKEKIRIQYFFVGTSIFLLLNIIFNIVLPILQNSFKHHQFGNYAAVVLLIFTAYAIAKHELMGIKTLITQILIIIISIILLVDILFLSNDITTQLLKVGVLVTFLYFSHGMVNSVKKEKKARKKLEDSHRRIDQNVKDLRDINIKLKERNEDLGVLLNVSDITTETLDPGKIAQ